jgi:toxin YoeB
MTVSFAKSAFADYKAWATEDKKIYDRINALIQDIARSPFSGLGKPEPLKYDLAGYWSRRINREHRLVYKVKDDMIFIAGCKFHYDL